MSMPDRSITKEDVIDEESEGLAPQEVELALKNVSNLFGGGETPSNAFNGSFRAPLSSGPGGRSGGLANVRGRNRVDSSARPPEFYRPDNKNKKNDHDPVDYRNFSVHGISEPLLRQRLESKAVSQDTVDRVKSDFAPHDHLSTEQIATLEEKVRAAHKLHVNKDDKGAEVIYQEVLDADPVHYECLTNLAKIAYARSEFGRAKELFERAIVVKPHFDKTVYHLAVVLHDMKDFERSQNLFNEVVQGFTGETDGQAEKCDTHTYHNAVAMLGLIHQQVHGDHDKAGILYNTVLTKNPDHVLTLDHKCSLLAFRNDREEASKLHKRVCSLDPNHTKKVCPYLDSLFPQNSDLFHPIINLPERLDKCSSDFQRGAKKKSWKNHPWRSLKKKLRRLVGSEQPAQPPSKCRTEQATSDPTPGHNLKPAVRASAGPRRCHFHRAVTGWGIWERSRGLCCGERSRGLGCPGDVGPLAYTFKLNLDRACGQLELERCGCRAWLLAGPCWDCAVVTAGLRGYAGSGDDDGATPGRVASA